MCLLFSRPRDPSTSPTRSWILSTLFHKFAKMTDMSTSTNEVFDSFDDKVSLSSFPQRANALSNKLTTVLSASYADSEIREALRILDERNIRNEPETRRKLRLEVQKNVIDCNGEIVKDFGQVAEVCPPGSQDVLYSLG